MPDGRDHILSVLVFSDVGRHAKRGQLFQTAGLLADNMEVISIYHVSSWSLHRARRGVKSTAAAEILAAGEAIDHGKVILQTLSTVFNIDVPILIALDSKDLFLPCLLRIIVLTNL